MKNTTLEPHQELSPQKKRRVVIKVILAMAILLLGIPFMMIVASTYFTNKGIMKDAYLMGYEYTKAVNDFYNTNQRCPTNEDIQATITSEDTVARIDFTNNPSASTCYITSTLKSLGTATDGKLLILAHTFSKQSASNAQWQCFSDANHWLLPDDCNNELPR